MHLALSLRFIGFALLFGALAYSALSLLAMLRRRDRGTRMHDIRPAPVTVLKPLCGGEPRLYENLRTFCLQDHPDYQLVFGVREADDAAIAVVRRLQIEFPERDITLIVDPRVHGLNLKVSNLMNLLPQARHDRLVFADSDISVRHDYLRVVSAPLDRPEVGLVTCLYRGRAIGGLWSRLGVQFIEGWFRPSIRLAQMFGATRFGFGATLALRRDTLTAIGGLESVSGMVADDYWLGERIADEGLQTLLLEREVVTDVVETRLSELVAHELRWFRTIRSVRPRSYLFVGVCFTLPVALFGALLAGLSTLTVVLAAAAVGSRALLFLNAQARTAGLREWSGNLAAFLLRDTLSLLLWAWALGGGMIRWRGQQLDIDTQTEIRVSS